MVDKCRIDDFRPGDLAIFAPVSWRHSFFGWLVGHTVSAATCPWDLGFQACHVGLVAQYRERLALYESTIDKGLGSCLHADKLVKGVQVHPLESRLRLHLGPRGGRAWRLPWLGCGSYDAVGLSRVYDRLSMHCRADLAVSYDKLGAFQSRCFGFGWTRRFRRERTDANRAFFCSEFAARSYQKMGWIGDDVIPSHENPKSLVRLLVDKLGVCGPPEEITP